MCAATPKSEGRRLSEATPPKSVERRACCAEAPPCATGKRRGNFSATPREVKMSKKTVDMAESTPGSVWWSNGEVRIQYQQENPKKPGTGAHVKYDQYKQATTVQEAWDMGAVTRDLKYDWEKKFVKLADGALQVSDAAGADISPQAETLQTEEELSSQVVGGTPLSAAEFPDISITSLYIIAEHVRLAAEVTDAELFVGSEYMVTVDKSRGDLLGLHVEADSETLLVEHVNPGLVHIWNALAAQIELDGKSRVADVRPGDCLVEVNGMRSVSDMIAELRKHQVLAMKFMVGEDPVLATKFKVSEDGQTFAALESAPATCNGCGSSDCDTCERLWEALCSECWG